MNKSGPNENPNPNKNKNISITIKFYIKGSFDSEYIHIHKSCKLIKHANVP